MKNKIEIETITNIERDEQALNDLLIRTVDSGGSVGFLPPISEHEASEYWGNVIKDEVILLRAKIDNQLVGTVQLHLCTKQNGKHRAEIAKLMTHPDYQRMGIGRTLMMEAEKIARQHDRSLLVLDTREGDVSNILYQSIGYIEGGRIPKYALSLTGELDATIFYYKMI